MRKLLSLVLGLVLTASAAAENFTLVSPAFKDKGRIPVLYTCNGDNISPPLVWDHAPAETQSFVLIFSAPNWINSEIYLWVLYNLPAKVKGLAQDVYELPRGTLTGTNFYDETKYRGPCPPNTREHEYVFTLYALDVKLEPIEDEIDPEKLLRIIKPHILKQVKLTGYFSH